MKRTKYCVQNRELQTYGAFLRNSHRISSYTLSHVWTKASLTSCSSKCAGVEEHPDEDARIDGGQRRSALMTSLAMRIWGCDKSRADALLCETPLIKESKILRASA